MRCKRHRLAEIMSFVVDVVQCATLDPLGGVRGMGGCANFGHVVGIGLSSVIATSSGFLNVR